ncbi:hypothetical protein LDENG_00215410, partial [Lucifuga dentata]
MKRVFDRSVAGHEAACEIMLLRQEHRTLTDYVIEFHTLAASSQWNERALYDAFWHGLSDNLKDKLASRELPATLNQLIDLVTRVDIRLHQRARERAYSRSRDTPVPLTRSPVTSSEPKPRSKSEPMQIKWTRLSPVERQRCFWSGACLYCGQKGHLRRSCPVKDSAHQSDGEILVGVSKHVKFPHRLLLPVILDFAGQRLPLSALLDSGADENFLDSFLAKKLKVPVHSLDQPREATALNGQSLSQVSHVTDPVRMTVSGNHSELTVFHVMDSPQ